MYFNPEKDPVLSSAERRLYVVVDGALDNLSRVVPPAEITQQELPGEVVDLDAYRQKKEQEAQTAPRITNVVNLEEKRQAAGVTAHERLEYDAREAIQTINRQSDESQSEVRVLPRAS